MNRVRWIATLTGPLLLFATACAGTPGPSPSGSPSSAASRPTAGQTVVTPSQQAVRCPVGSSPDVPGPAGQARPAVTEDLLYLPAAQDARTGRLLAWDSTTRSTWAFDVCANTWRDLRTAGGPPDAVNAMVYSVADDVLIVFVRTQAGDLAVWTYTPATNRWAALPLPTVSPSGFWMPNAAYDTRTGTVYVRDAATGALWFYTLSLNRWTVVSQFGELPPSRAVRQSAGQCTWMVYDVAADRLVLILGVEDPDARTWMFDPAARTWTRVRSEAPRLATGYSESGAEAVYDAAHARTVVVVHDTTAAFDATTGAWSRLLPRVVPPAGSTPVVTVSGSTLPVVGAPDDRLVRLDETLVYDAVNRRVLMVGGLARMSGSWPPLDDVWAYDLGTDSWLRLVAPTW